MGHQNSDAAARSVEKSKKVEAKASRTPEQRIKDIRNNAQGILSVPNAEVVFLLERYDLILSELAKTQISLSAANLRIAELDQVCFQQAQKVIEAAKLIPNLILPAGTNAGTINGPENPEPLDSIGE